MNNRIFVCDFSSKISCFLSCLFLWLLVSSSVCLPTTWRERELFKKTQKSRRSYFSGRFFALAILLHYLNADLSLDLEHTTKLRERECYFTRAPSFSLRVVLYERGAAGLTRAFFFAKDGQTDGTDEAFADSIAVTETRGTEIDRTRSRWT